MKITLVAAVSRNGYIGKDNKLPWRIKAEIAHFLETVKDKPVVVGRKTFDGLPKSMQTRPNTIILSKTDPRGVDSMLKAVEVAKAGGFNEIMVIGGANVYEQAIPMADELIISYIHKDVEGDVKMPEVPYVKWKAAKVNKAEEFTIIWWKRRNV